MMSKDKERKVTARQGLRSAAHLIYFLLLLLQPTEDEQTRNKK